MSFVSNIFNKNRPDKDELKLTRDSIHKAISLAGFRGAKIRRYIQTISGSNLVACEDFERDKLEATFKNLSGRRAATHVSVVEEACSASSLRKSTLKLYRQHVVAKGLASPTDTQPDPAVQQQELDNWIALWREEIRLLNVHARHQLEQKFERELNSAVKAMQRDQQQGGSDAEQGKSADAATGALKTVSNLEAFERGEAARRADLAANRTPYNNWPPVTSESLRRGNREQTAKAASSSTQIAAGSAKGSDGEGVVSPASAQTVDADGFLIPRPTQ